jgi:hypothetical protein
MARKNVWTFMSLTTLTYGFFMMLWNVADITRTPIMIVGLMTFASYCVCMGNKSGKRSGF